MNNNASARSIIQYFLLTFALMIPFWVLGTLTERQLLPGLPIAALGVLCPTIAALIRVNQTDKRAGVVALLRRAFDIKHIKDKRWYAPILLLLPVTSVLSFGVLRLMGVPVPVPQLAIVPTLMLCVLFFVSALSEELGWSGYALDLMQSRWGALKASVILGLVWSVYHYVALVQAHRSLAWIAWWTVYTVAARVIMVWLYNNTGKSVFGMALFHMMLNVTWQLFPVDGSYFDPQVAGLILAAAAILVMIGSPSMQRHHNASLEAHTVD